VSDTETFFSGKQKAMSPTRPPAMTSPALWLLMLLASFSYTEAVLLSAQRQPLSEISVAADELSLVREKRATTTPKKAEVPPPPHTHPFILTKVGGGQFLVSRNLTLYSPLYSSKKYLVCSPLHGSEHFFNPRGQSSPPRGKLVL
jgi:hypothetical protein